MTANKKPARLTTCRFREKIYRDSKSIQRQRHAIRIAAARKRHVVRAAVARERDFVRAIATTRQIDSIGASAAREIYRIRIATAGDCYLIRAITAASNGGRSVGTHRLRRKYRDQCDQGKHRKKNLFHNFSIIVLFEPMSMGGAAGERLRLFKKKKTSLTRGVLPATFQIKAPWVSSAFAEHLDGDSNSHYCKVKRMGSDPPRYLDIKKSRQPHPPWCDMCPYPGKTPEPLNPFS